MVELGIMLYMTVLGMTMVLLFVDSRLSRRKTALAVYGTTILVMAALVLICCAWGVETAMRLYTVAVHLPSLILFTCLSRYRGWRLVFQILSICPL